MDKKGGLKYVLFMGEPGHEATVKRTAGVKKGLEDLGYKLEAVYEDTAMWSRAEAQNKMQTIVAKNFDVVICNNDEMALESSRRSAPRASSKACPSSVWMPLRTDRPPSRRAR